MDLIDEDEPFCYECNGEGVRVTCFDDICVGLGYCMHGDGMVVCGCQADNAYAVPEPKTLPRRRGRRKDERQGELAL